MRKITATLIVAWMAGMGPAGAAVLSTAFEGGNGANGEVFQIQALTNITINDFGVNAVNGVLAAGDITTWTLYQHDGLLSSATAGSAIWTQVASGGAVTSAGADAITNLTAGLNIAIAAGTTEAFLLLESPLLLGYTTGGAVGAVMAPIVTFRFCKAGANQPPLALLTHVRPISALSMPPRRRNRACSVCLASPARLWCRHGDARAVTEPPD